MTLSLPPYLIIGYADHMRAMKNVACKYAMKKTRIKNVMFLVHFIILNVRKAISVRRQENRFSLTHYPVTAVHGVVVYIQLLLSRRRFTTYTHQISELVVLNLISDPRYLSNFSCKVFKNNVHWGSMRGPIHPPSIP